MKSGYTCRGKLQILRYLFLQTYSAVVVFLHVPMHYGVLTLHSLTSKCMPVQEKRQSRTMYSCLMLDGFACDITMKNKLTCI